MVKQGFCRCVRSLIRGRHGRAGGKLLARGLRSDVLMLTCVCKRQVAKLLVFALFPPALPDVRELVMERVRKHFQPEFLNRIDEFICFEPLR